MKLPFTVRSLRSAFSLYRAALKADGHSHTICRECGDEVPEAESYYTDAEQAALFPDVPAIVRVPKKDCPACGAAHTEDPWYEPLYGMPPRDMCLRLAHGELRRVFRVEKLYSYPEGHRARRREVIWRWHGRTIRTRLEPNPRANDA